MKSTGEPEAVKWFWKKVSLIRKMIVIFSKYIMIEIVTVSAVKGWNREKTITTLGTAAPDWKKHWAVGESITRNTRYHFLIISRPKLTVVATITGLEN